MDYPKVPELDADVRSSNVAVAGTNFESNKVRLTLPALGCCGGRIAGREPSEMSALEIPEHIQLRLMQVKSEHG